MSISNVPTSTHEVKITPEQDKRMKDGTSGERGGQHRTQGRTLQGCGESSRTDPSGRGRSPQIRSCVRDVGGKEEVPGGQGGPTPQ